MTIDTHDDRMRITVVGGGAVGLVFAGLLSTVDDVSLLVRRRDQAETIATSGIQIDGPDSSETYRPNVSADPAVMNDSEFVIVLTKTYDTAMVAKTIANNAKRDATVLTLQNGIGSVDVLNTYCGKNCVLYGITLIGSHRESDCHAVYSVLHRVIVGEQDGPATERCKRIVNRLSAVGFDGTASDRVESEVWTKLALSIAQNALSALTDKSFGALRNSDAALAFVRSSLAEFRLLADAKGIELLADPYEQLMSNWSRIPKHHSSMWQDLQAEKRTEIDAMNGAIVELGKHHGIAMPANETITNLIKVRESK
jgi:2-dehydropantoate 2-reductase